jgi:hypothetical protein
MGSFWGMGLSIGIPGVWLDVAYTELESSLMNKDSSDIPCSIVTGISILLRVVNTRVIVTMAINLSEEIYQSLGGVEEIQTGRASKLPNSCWVRGGIELITWRFKKMQHRTTQLLKPTAKTNVTVGIQKYNIGERVSNFLKPTKQAK